jgi:hypothetical protein
MRKASKIFRFGFIILGILFCFLKSGLAQRGMDLNRGLIAYYPFTHQAKDSTANHHDAVLVRVNKERDVNGEKKGSYRWNSKKDRIELPIDINAGAMPQISLCAWVFPLDYHSSITVISNDDGGGDRKIFATLKGEKRVWACSDGKGGFVGDIQLVRKKWVFLVATYNAKNKRVALYVDGVRRSGPYAVDMGSSKTYIGASPRGNEAFEALIDEVRIYDRILSKAEIDSLRRLKNPLNPPQKEAKDYFYLARQDNLLVHAKPSTKSAVVGKINKSDTLQSEILVPSLGGKYKEWLKIKQNGKVAYVQVKYLKHQDRTEVQKTDLERKIQEYVNWSKWQFWVGLVVLMILGFLGSFRFAAIDRILNRLTRNDFEGNTAYFPIFMAISAVLMAILMVFWQDDIEYYIGQNFSFWPVGYGFPAWAVWSLAAINSVVFLIFFFESLFCGNLIHGLFRILIQLLLAAVLLISVFIISIALIMLVILLAVVAILLRGFLYRRVYRDGWGNTYVE